jgi:alpha-galactosidase
MADDLLNSKIAGFLYNGEEECLIPKTMKKRSSGVFEKTFEKGLKVTLEFENPVKDAYKWVVWFENTGSENTFCLKKAVVGAEIPCCGTDQAVWRGLKGDDCCAESFMPLEKKLKPGSSVKSAPKGGRSSNTSAFPFFDLSYGDKSLVCGIGWSGQWESKVSRSDKDVTLTVGQADWDLYLKPGEKLRTPSVLLCFGGEDIEQSRHAFRRVMREFYTPARYMAGHVDMPIALQTFDRYYWKEEIRNNVRFNTEKTQVDIIRAGEKIGGIDTHWIDACWMKGGFPAGIGNYDFAEGFPHEFGVIPEEAEKTGQRFMVWFEPERVHKGSSTYREMKDIPGRLLELKAAPEQEEFYRDNVHLNLGDEEAREWLFKILSGIIRRNRIKIYRQDYNINPLEFWQQADEKGRKGVTENMYIQGLYWLWDSLIAEFPGILIDNCSSGGRRIDLETCYRAVPCWRSDTNCIMDSGDKPSAVWNQNQTLGLSRYIPYHTGASFTEDAYHFRSGAQRGMNMDFDVLNKDYDYKAAAEAVKEMDIIKPAWEGDFYPLTSQSLKQDVWSGYQLENGGKGICMFFRRAESAESEKKFVLKGIDKGAEYLVRYHDEERRISETVIKGKELAKTGLPVKIPQKNASVLVEYGKNNE